MDNQKDNKDAQQSTAEEQLTHSDTVEDQSVASATESEEEKPEDTKTSEGDDAPTAKLDSEEDLEEKDHEEHEDDEDEQVDYSALSKEELVDLIKSLSKDDNIIKSDRIAREIKVHFDEIRDHERDEALKKFIADGGEEADFDFKNDELINRFDANYKLIHDRKVQYVKEKEKQKDANLKKKEEVLEKLREFVDSDESNESFEAFKEIQNEWKSIGPVPGAYVKTLWANYNALLDRFYDNRSIYFELKELDRKKNLEAKLELCERAEKLSEMDNLKEAIKELNELHHEFKHIGPVPSDEREALWLRFKTASDAVYSNRKEYVEQLKVELEANLKIKEQLAEEVQAFATFDSDRIKEWNAKTKELLEIQKKWDATGGLPRAKSKEINKKFWSSFKTFFHHKGQFFKKLDAQRGDNLEKKQELVKQAEVLKESTEWSKTANALKNLQKQWREIGPVPEKYRESVYQEFKAACDHFFDQKRASQGIIEKEFVENYNQKVAICDEINKLADEKSDDLDKLYDLQDKFESIGFVPRKNIGEIKNKYSQAVDHFVNSIEGITDEERGRIRLENQLNKISQGPNAEQKIYRKEQAIRKQISQVENDIALWKNNLEFFADSKTANKLKDEFNDKIKSANSELKNLKQQLRIIRTA